MARAPDGAVIGDIHSDDDDPAIDPAGDPEREAEERRDPNPRVGAGAIGGAGAVGGAGARPRRHRTPERPCRPRSPENPNPIHELIAALREAALDPARPERHGLDPPRERPRVKIQPPVFKGMPGERPDAHLLAAADWMEVMRVHPIDFIDNFRHTLQHLAREWYQGLDIGQFRGNWREFSTHFSKYFSTQGRNIKHLHERWRTFSFDPTTDDIEEYIRDVKEAAKQLGHGDGAVLNLLKATMPTELYGTLYGHNNLAEVTTMLKDIYARKPQNNVAAATGAAQGATAPFTHIRSPTGGAPKAQSNASLEDRILQLTETLYRIDMNGKPPRKPFKPFITQPRRRFKPNRNGRNGKSFPQNQRGKQQGFRGRFKFRRPFGKFDKSPNAKRPRVSGRPFNKDKIRCFRCKEFGHMQKDCPEQNRPSQEDTSGPKKFEDYTYTYSGPDVQPPMPRLYSNQPMATNYDQALGAIKDSLSTANPLASLNL